MGLKGWIMKTEYFFLFTKTECRMSNVINVKYFMVDYGLICIHRFHIQFPNFLCNNEIWAQNWASTFDWWNYEWVDVRKKKKKKKGKENQIINWSIHSNLNKKQVLPTNNAIPNGSITKVVEPLIASNS